MIRAILIDPFTQQVREIQLAAEDGAPTLRAVYQAIGCDCICAGPRVEGRDGEHFTYLDDEGLLRDPIPPGFMLPHYPIPLAGRAVVLGLPKPYDDGREQPCTLSVEEVAGLVRWVTITREPG